MSKILITTSSFNVDTPEVTALESAGYEVVLNPHKRRLTAEEVSALLTPDVIGMIAGVEPLTADVLNKTQGLQVISRCGAGLDSVDAQAAQQKNIKIFNTPDAPSAAVAELTIGLILSVLRSIPLQDQAIRSGEWERPMGGLLGKKTLGLIGLGRIGMRVAQIAKSFGSTVIACDPYAKETDVADLISFDTLLKESDIISLHIPYTKENHHLINKKTLSAMKEGSVLINASRGGLVDEDAAVQALQSEHLSAAAFDVFEEEPYTGPLTQIKNAVLTAHVGSYAKETRALQEAESAQNLLVGLTSDNEGIRAYG